MLIEQADGAGGSPSSAASTTMTASAWVSVASNRNPSVSAIERMQTRRRVRVACELAHHVDAYAVISQQGIAQSEHKDVACACVTGTERRANAGRSCVAHPYGPRRGANAS
ncbi:MAG: hypothetical protein WDN49_04785 [Acetobacteraceae bacterium]